MPRVTFGQDLRGNFRRRIGWELVGGKLKQHQFYFGKDERVARERAELLETVWAGVERVWGATAYHRQSLSGRPIWDEATLAIAMTVARGEPEVAVDIPGWLRDYLGRADQFENVPEMIDGKVESAFVERDRPLPANQERTDRIIAEYVATLRRHIPRPTIRLTDPAPEERERERIRNAGTAMTGMGRSLLDPIGESATTRPEQLLGTELSLALRNPLQGLVFAEDGIRVTFDDGGQAAIPWADVGAALAGCLQGVNRSGAAARPQNTAR